MSRVPTGSIDYPYGFATALQGEVEWWLCIPKWIPPPTTSNADNNDDGVRVTSVVAPASSEGGVWVDWLFPVTDTDGKFAEANPDFDPLAGDRVFRSTNKFESFGKGSVRARIEAFIPDLTGTAQSTSSAPNERVQMIVSAVPPQPSLRAILPPTDPDEDEPPLGCFFMPGVVLHYAHERKPRSTDPSSLEPLKEMCRHFYVKKDQIDSINALYAKNYADVIVTKTMEGDVVILDAAEAAHHKKMSALAAKQMEQAAKKQEHEDKKMSEQATKKLEQAAKLHSSRTISGAKRAREAPSSSSEEEATGDDEDELDSDEPRQHKHQGGKDSRHPKVKKEDTKEGAMKGRVLKRESRKKELASVVMEGKDVLPPNQFIPVIFPPDLAITKEVMNETGRRIRVVERGERPNAVCLHDCCLVAASTSLPSAATPSTTLYLYIPYAFVGRIASVMMGNKLDHLRKVSVHAIEVVGKLLGASKIPNIVPILRAHESVHAKTQLPFLVPLRVDAIVGGSARLREGDFVGLGVDADAFVNQQNPTNPNKSNLQLDQYTRWACDKSLVVHRKCNSSSGRAFEVSTAELHVATDRTVTPQRQVSAPAGMLQRLEEVLGRYKPQHAVPAENGALDDSVSDEEESEDGESGSDIESDTVSTASSGITRAYRDLLAACQYAKDIQQYHPINHTTAAIHESNDDSIE